MLSYHLKYFVSWFGLHILTDLPCVRVWIYSSPRLTIFYASSEYIPRLVSIYSTRRLNILCLVSLYSTPRLNIFYALSHYILRLVWIYSSPRLTIFYASSEYILCLVSLYSMPRLNIFLASSQYILRVVSIFFASSHYILRLVWIYSSPRLNIFFRRGCVNSCIYFFLSSLQMPSVSIYLAQYWSIYPVWVWIHSSPRVCR
jgi:hypothetical protein